jgi:FdhD protein
MSSRNGNLQAANDLASPAPIVTHSKPLTYLEYQGDEVSRASKPMVIESAWPLIINGQYWLTVLCTPSKLDCFVLGFLYNEGLISGPTDMLDLHIGQPPEAMIHVELRDRDLRLPQHRTLTSGCGGGITFIDLAAAREPVHSALQATPRQISDLMARLMATVADDYRRVGGFHTAGLSDGHQLLVIATDIGRHNTLDKVAGECLSRNISMQDAILLTTGRVSVEMLGKAARMKVPVVGTLNSPTHLAVELARAWHITLIGYTRGTRMHVYADQGRIA